MYLSYPALAARCCAGISGDELWVRLPFSCTTNAQKQRGSPVPRQYGMH